MSVIFSSDRHKTVASPVCLALTAELIGSCDAVLIATDRVAIDYALVAQHAKVIVDSRNAMERRGLSLPNLVKP